MLRELWRVYRGIAAVVFTMQLLLLLWFLITSGALTSPLASTVPAPAATATPAPGAAPEAPADAGTRFTLEVSDAEVNRLLARQENPAPAVQDLELHFEAGRVGLDARMADPLPVTVQASGKLVSTNGRLRFDLDEANAGFLPLPGPALDLLEGVANEALADTLEGRDVYVETVELSPGLARLSARVPATP